MNKLVLILVLSAVISGCSFGGGIGVGGGSDGVGGRIGIGSGISF
ncbi:hypothetical protein [Rodentibacter caecimuris]